MTLSVAVPHTPWDEARAANIAAYGLPGMVIVEDSEREGCWPTVRRAWQLGIESGASHHLVLTDDLTLAEGFRRGLLNAIEARPDDILSLLTVRPGAKDAAARGVHWCVSWDGATGAANVLPAHLIADFLSWEATHIDPDCPHDDVRLVAWALQSTPRRRTYTPVPCLVDHGAFPSVIDDSPAFGQLHSPASIFCTTDAGELDFAAGLHDPVPIGASTGRLMARVRDERLIQRR